METDRRDFLKLAGMVSLSLIVPGALPPFFPALGHAAPSRPLQGKRWAMAIDPSKCPPGCVDCITACHSVHNVPDLGDRKDEIKWIWREEFASAFPAEKSPYLREDIGKLRLPVLCNQCANPPCVRVCPTKATFKRPDGIVMMDYHRCIGCRFCMAACPYGARSMNYRDPRPFIRKITPDFPTRTKGVVEKCNFCDERLARGLAPACVAACPEKAMFFGDLENPGSDVRKVIGGRFSLRRRSHLGTEPQVYYLL